MELPIELPEKPLKVRPGGRWYYVFVERIWRSVKYEEIYLHAYASVKKARTAIGRYLTFYNGLLPHSSLDHQTPDEAYFNASQPIPAAA